MDYFPSGIGALRQLYPENVGHLLNHYVQRQAEVICPEPRRILGKPFSADSPNRLCSKQRSLLSRRWEAPEIFDIILSSSDDSDSDLSSPRQIGFLCGSPPTRSINPLAQDSKFEAGPDSRVGGNPTVRIEGFSPVTTRPDVSEVSI